MSIVPDTSRNPILRTINLLGELKKTINWVSENWVCQNIVSKEMRNVQILGFFSIHVYVKHIRYVLL